MRFSVIHALAPALVFATAELGSMATAAPTTQDMVAEIVTFRLKDDVNEAAFLKAAEATKPFLTSTGAVLARSLSKDADGLWTDYILWSSMQAAKDTEAQAMQRPEFGAFFVMMDENSVSLRHAPIVLQMD